MSDERKVAVELPPTVWADVAAELTLAERDYAHTAIDLRGTVNFVNAAMRAERLRNAITAIRAATELDGATLSTLGVEVAA